MADFNPYAPPQAVSDVARAPVQLPRGRALKWIYGGLAGVTFFVLVLTHLVAYSDETQVLWDAVGVIDKPIALVRIVLALMWIHGAWSDVPRQLRAELDVTPGGAVGRLFIPAFNLYWMFALNQKLCTAIDRVLVGAGQRPAAPFALATLAPALHIGHAIFSKVSEGLPVLFSFGASSLLWFVYMYESDGARAKMLADPSE